MNCQIQLCLKPFVSRIEADLKPMESQYQFKQQLSYSARLKGIFNIDC